MAVTTTAANRMHGSQRNGQLSRRPRPVLPALQMARTPRFAQRVALFTLVFVILLIPIMFFAPWVQTVHGMGRAIAFNPLYRPQPLVSPIEGRVKRWYVVEGDKVQRGQLIAELVDNDPRILDRLRENEQLAMQRMTLADQIVSEQASRLNFLELEQPLLIEAERARRDAAELQVLQFQQELLRAKDDFIREEQAYNRMLELYKDKSLGREGTVVSKDQLEEAERKRNLAKNRVPLVQSQVDAAEKQVIALTKSVESLEQRLPGVLAQERAVLRSRESERQSVQQQLNAARTALQKQLAQYITAPADGTIFQILVNADGQLVRPGQPLGVLVPEVSTQPWFPAADEDAKGSVLGAAAAISEHVLKPTDYPAIVTELFIDGNDLPLVQKGDRTLLQFEGWPAVQVAGVPRAAQGTFEGKVYLVDPTANENGNFRILVEPWTTEPDGVVAEDGRFIRSWPQQDLLRQGVRAQGWVLIRQVSVGYELWRLLNGFPPARPLELKPKTSPIGPVAK